MSSVEIDDMEIEELLKQFKKRDLVQTYFFKVACRVFGPPKCRDRVLIAAPMHVLNSAPHIPVVRLLDLTPSFRKNKDKVAMFVDLPVQRFTTFPADRLIEKQDWVRERRAFRKMLDGIGNLSQWIKNKPTVTELELKMAARESVHQRVPPIGSELHLTPLPKVSTQQSESPSLTLQVRTQRTPEQVRRHFRGHETLILEICNQLDPRDTGKISPRDLRTVFEKAGMRVTDERLDALVACLSDAAGCVTVAALAAGIWAWIEGGCEEDQHSDTMASLHTLTHTLLQEREEHARIHLYHQQRKKGGMQDEEVLAILQTLRSGNCALDAHSAPSSLAGHMGSAVDRYRRQCLGEYLDSLEHSQQQGISISQSSMQRVLLHPGDVPLHGGGERGIRQAGTTPLPGCAGRLCGSVTKASGLASKEERKEKEEEIEADEPPKKVHKERSLYPACWAVQKEPKLMNLSTGRAEVRHKTECWLTQEEYVQMSGRKKTRYRRADPSAFWPGQEDHVRLYLPQMGIPPERALFHHITQAPTPSPGAWPVNDRGYSTSGDMDGQKAYAL